MNIRNTLRTSFLVPGAKARGARRSCFETRLYSTCTSTNTSTSVTRAPIAWARPRLNPRDVARSVTGAVAAGAVLFGIATDSSCAPSTRVRNNENIGNSFPFPSDDEDVGGKPAESDVIQQDPSYARTYIEEFCFSNASWIPGGRSYLEAAFKDLDSIEQRHKEEVDCILDDVFRDLRHVANEGYSIRNVRRVFAIFSSLEQRLGEVAMMERHGEC